MFGRPNLTDYGMGDTQTTHCTATHEWRNWSTSIR
jgi:hypothetical protein